MLALSASFEYQCCWSTTIVNSLPFQCGGSTLDVRLLESDISAMKGFKFTTKSPFLQILDPSLKTLNQWWLNVGPAQGGMIYVVVTELTK